LLPSYQHRINKKVNGYPGAEAGRAQIERTRRTSKIICRLNFREMVCSAVSHSLWTIFCIRCTLLRQTSIREKPEPHGSTVLALQDVNWKCGLCRGDSS
ncbi:mCG145294, partial [Mus musculus]